MTIARWTPPVAPTRQEQFLLKRLGSCPEAARAFCGCIGTSCSMTRFKRSWPSMYRTTGAGKEALPPAMMAMAMLVQGYLGISDAEMVELTVVDLRVQMVLGCLGAEAPPFSQGALQEFRERLIAADLDRRVLERTVELAKRTKAFDHRKLPKTLRVAIDSSPLEGAGRRRGHVQLAGPCGATMWSAVRPACSGGQTRRCAGRRAFPCSWSRASSARSTSTGTMPSRRPRRSRPSRGNSTRCSRGSHAQLPEALAKPPLQAHVETLVQIRTQDLEPDPTGGGSRIREGVAEDRRVSIEDPEMRHGRKSKSKRFNGFKRHIAADVDRGLILACAITPANRPEDEAMPSLTVDMARQGLAVDHLLIDRGYINSTLVDEVLGRRGTIVCKPWKSRNGRLFPKSAFTLNIRDRTIECPNGQVQRLLVRHRGRIRSRRLRSMSPARAMHHRRVRPRALGRHRGERTAAAAAPQTDPHRRRARRAARAHDDRTQARPHLATPRERRTLSSASARTPSTSVARARSKTWRHSICSEVQSQKAA